MRTQQQNQEQKVTELHVFYSPFPYNDSCACCFMMVIYSSSSGSGSRSRRHCRTLENPSDFVKNHINSRPDFPKSRGKNTSPHLIRRCASISTGLYPNQNQDTAMKCLVITLTHHKNTAKDAMRGITKTLLNIGGWPFLMSVHFRHFLSCCVVRVYGT